MVDVVAVVVVTTVAFATLVVAPAVEAAAISLLATGLPRPVTMSYPVFAVATKFDPLVMSWKSVV